MTNPDDENSNERVPGDREPTFAGFRVAKHGRIIAAGFLILATLLQAAVEEGETDRLRNAVFDLYQRISPREISSLPIAIVDIDERSLAQFGQWPWPRTLLARLSEKTAALKPLAIGYDIVFVEPDRLSPHLIAESHPGLSLEAKSSLKLLPSNDEMFGKSIGRLPMVVGRIGLPNLPPDKTPASAGILPVQIEGIDPSSHLTSFVDHVVNVPEISKAARGYGYINTIQEADGSIRRMPVVMTVGGKIVPSLGLELVRVALGANWLTVVGSEHGLQNIKVGQSTIDADRKGALTIHFSHSDSRRRFSAADVLAGRIPPAALTNKIVLIGSSGLGLTDAVPTPVTARMDGVEIQAQFIENLIAGTRLKRPEVARFGEGAALLIAGIILIFLVPRLSPSIGSALFVGMALIFLAVGYGAFANARLLLDPVIPTFSIALIFLTLQLGNLVEADRNRRVLSANLQNQRLQNARMTGELNAAREMQKSILPNPDSIENLPSNVDVHAVLEPAKEVGGDFYDLFMIDDHRFFFLIADVSGKGVPASLFMAMSKALCKSTVMNENGSVADLIGTANHQISMDNPKSMFVTAVAGILDTQTGEVQFCNAGHDTPYRCRQGSAPEPLESEGGLPLGIMEGFAYPTEHQKLQPGDALVLITDGVNEAITVEDTAYGTDRVLNYLNNITPDTSAKAISNGLHDDVISFVGDNEQFDDITIVVIRYLSSGGD
ncbi:MAG: CHASE2 domain-containing protein [Rhodospirillaceae bacterium]|nr:CHASE2 domain-containing protein [Rhodospirillaceae bacterium]